MRPSRPQPITSPSGLVAHLNANGSLRRLEHGQIVLNLFPGSEVEGGPTNIYLRRRGAEPLWTPLLGPRSPLAFHLDGSGSYAAGEWERVRVTVSLRLAAAAPAWFWHVALENLAPGEVTLDLVYAQDVALAHYGAIRMNEYYVSQYLDHAPLDHPRHGTAVAVRQNLPMDGRHPWALIGALAQAASFATDALQVHGLATRAGESPAGLAGAGLPGARRQHEHAMVALQDAPVHLGPGKSVLRGFFGWFEPDHPAATSDADLAVVDRALALPEASASPGPAPGTRPTATLFSTAPMLQCRDLTDAEIASVWGKELRHVEREDGRLLSFFTDAATHVALRAKELRVLRPHGHLIRTGDGLTPDEASLTTTVWMAGVFNSLLTQGHVGINRLLSTTRSYLSLQRAHGQRMFVELDGRWHLLDVPSAWEITATAARWLYAHAGGVIEVRVAAAPDRHAIDVTVTVRDGAPARFLVSSHVALNGDDGVEPVPVRLTRDGVGLVLRAVPDSDVGRRFPDGTFRIDPPPGTVVDQVGGDELLFADEASRDQPYVVIVTSAASTASFRITGELVRTPPVAATTVRSTRLEGPAASALARDVARLDEILPWYVHDALIHYLGPRGLEQFSGGGWGTRDVCQGPVELLLALDLGAPVRDLLLRVFANQNSDGDWPQWFMFFARERGIRPAESHGDIVFWPLLALGRYVLATADAAILDAVVPFFEAAGDDRAERATVWRHVERAFTLIDARMIPGTRLVAFGHGDWDDSLQPADPSMRDRLCSSWTVTLHHQTLTTLASALRSIGRGAEAAALETRAAAVRDDFARRLIPDGTLPGFAYFREDGQVDYLLHPRDRETGIRYRLLPMIHAVIADMLTPAQATSHVAIIREHLLGADGARLFDRPPTYRGGPQRHFQRAESSTFFGREIGLMYTHAHLRYAEAMARLGDADALFEALRRVSPIALSTVVPTALPRQANCYYSSSDAVVADRYEAAARYDDVRAGRVGYEGGWRVYSSGAGIAVRLVHECFLGLQRGREVLGVDPVVPKALDGLRVETTLDGHAVRVLYRVAAAGYGPIAMALNGAPLPMTRAVNPYRTAGVTVPMAAIREHLGDGPSELVIELG
jgi:cellobiose phosphorylase